MPRSRPDDRSGAKPPSRRSKRTIQVVGIDCAAQPANVGLAFGTWRAGRGSVASVATARTWDALADRVAEACVGPTLLAVDAPLGWPTRLGRRLHRHRAGAPIPDAANALFRRETDDFVHATLGKRPLDVGADRIARAAIGALGLLEAVRERTEEPIDLAWRPADVAGARAIEVYPAASLRARSWVDAGYKGKEASALARRRTLVDRVEQEVETAATVREAAVASDHLLDAVISVLAGFDFLRGDCVPPADPAGVVREGWIWVRPPVSADRD